MDAALRSSTSISISAAGTSLRIENNLRAGNVVDPAFVTSASTRQRTPTSRSVVVRLRLPLDACINTFDRIGSVVLVLTTFCTRCNPSRIVGPLAGRPDNPAHARH